MERRIETMVPTKEAVKVALGCTSDAELADWFEMSRSAAHQWPEKKPIPKARLRELQRRRPDLFVCTIEMRKIYF